MIDAQGHIVLIDYGLSKQEVSHPRGAQSLVGTPDYSAPEVLKTGVYRIENAEREKKEKKKKAPPPDGSSMGYGKAADWWSVGVMIYEMLAGIPPFRGSDLRQTYQNVLFADLKFSPQEKFSEESMTLLRGMIQRDPSLRWGAWSNPPTDIMESDFFKPVDWASIYDRRSDGPWIPPEEPLLVKKRRELQRQESLAADGESTNIAGWEDNLDASAVKTLPARAPNAAVSNYRQSSDAKGPSNLLASEVSSNDHSELLHVRDSIFATSMMPQENIIQDWSFVDAAALSPAVSSQGRRGGSLAPLSAGKSQNRQDRKSVV